MVTFPEPLTQLHRMADEIEARLRLVFPPTLFDFQIGPPIPSKDEWNRLTRRKPAIILAWAGIEPDPKDGRLIRGPAKWVLYLVVDNTDMERRFRGDERGLGLFGLVTAAIAILHGRTIPDVGTMFVQAVESLTKEEWGNESTAIAGLSIVVDFMPDNGIATTDIDDLLRVGATWLVNGAAAASDLSDLET